jgi:transposase InsO family protein
VARDTVERSLIDNGSPYCSAIHALACRTLGIRHLRTRPRRPQINGEAERFTRTPVNALAYGAIYASSTERTAALDGWLPSLQTITPTPSHRPTTTHPAAEQPSRSYT